MELGVDIGGLSVVHMRNAPPNSAIYAQRSGRAGRSGQGALVFTYCSNFSAHDRHFFKHQVDLVAGAVETPRLDLFNRELLLSHLNALAVSEVGIPGLDILGGKAPSLAALVATDEAGMPLSRATTDGLALNGATLDSIRSTFKRAIYDFAAELQNRPGTWDSDGWIDSNLSKLAENLDLTLDRWRKLHHAAKSALAKSADEIKSGLHPTSSEYYRRLTRVQHQSTRQLNLLMNDQGGRSTELSEFYPYRYLAAEGYLPGYNFTRLPIRIFLPTSETGGEFISRPRSIALREFGPRSIIYHNGRKFRVDQLVVREAEDSLTSAKVSTKAGYFLRDSQKELDFCPFSGANLADNANCKHVHDLMEMGEGRGTEVDRISCEEEERVAGRYDIETYFSVDGSLDRIRRSVARVGDSHLLNLRYIPAARLAYLNRKKRTAAFEGFALALTTGFWRAGMPPPEEQKEPYRLVKLWTSTIADALYIEPILPLGLDPNGVISLQYALKRGIELEFQIEPSEIGVVAIGDPAAPNILIYEAAEGSLGVLSRFADDPLTPGKVVRRAIELCRYDDHEYKAKASYSDLLSYYNDRDHWKLDRFAIKDALEKLLASQIEVQSNSNFASYDAHYQSLLSAFDPRSSLERQFLEYLYEHNLRLPDAAQRNVEGIYCRPDFFYEPRFWVFIDGSPHDSTVVMERDTSQRQAIMDRGDEVWSFHYSEDLAQKIASRPDIFRKVR